MKDGSLAPLFINKKSRLPIGQWLEAEYKPTKGYMPRKGWHCTLIPYAPHLSQKNRVWVEVEVQDYEELVRPESQGGSWVLAQEMKIVRELHNFELVIMMLPEDLENIKLEPVWKMKTVY